MKDTPEIFVHIPAKCINIFRFGFMGQVLFSKFYSIFPKEGTLTVKFPDSTMELCKGNV